MQTMRFDFPKIKVQIKNIAYCVSFSGRMNRQSFQRFLGIVFSILFLIHLLGLIVNGLKMLIVVCFMISIIPIFSAIVRRFHDFGRSGWYLFLLLIPLVGQFAFAMLFFASGNSGTNQYGKVNL
mgnify:CR=1 FL=1